MNIPSPPPELNEITAKVTSTSWVDLIERACAAIVVVVGTYKAAIFKHTRRKREEHGDDHNKRLSDLRKAFDAHLIESHEALLEFEQVKAKLNEMEKSRAAEIKYISESIEGHKDDLLRAISNIEHSIITRFDKRIDSVESRLNSK